MGFDLWNIKIKEMMNQNVIEICCSIILQIKNTPSIILEAQCVFLFLDQIVIETQLSLSLFFPLPLSLSFSLRMEAVWCSWQYTG